MNSNQRPTLTGQKKKWDTLRRRRLGLLKYYGITTVQIAKEVGRSEKTVGTVVRLYPEKKSRHIQEYIAQRLKTSYERLWGTADDHTAIVANKKRAVND